MSKFDIRGFLTENKLTDVRRGKTYQFGKVEINPVGKKLLTEMVMKADPDEKPVQEWDSDDLTRDQENDTNFTGDNAPEGKIPGVEEGQDIAEAGYTDDDEYPSGDDGFDFSAGDALVNRIGGGKAKKAFEKAAGTSEPDDADVDPYANDRPDGEEGDDFQSPEQMSDTPAANVTPGLASQLKYDPNQIEFDMEDDELDNFLNGFRRPQVAVKVLQRALDQAKAEIEDSPGVKKMYLVLDNGFYKTSAFRKGNVIATVRRTK